MKNAQQVLADAYLSLRPFDEKGVIVSEREFYAGRVLLSASQRLAYGKTRYGGSVDKLTTMMEEK